MGCHRYLLSCALVLHLHADAAFIHRSSASGWPHGMLIRSTRAKARSGVRMAAPSANEAAQLIRAKDTRQAASTFQQMTDHVGISPEGIALFHANDYINAMAAFRTQSGPRSIENAVWEAACVYGREGRVKARGRAGVGALGESLVDGSGGRSEEALAMVHELFRGRQSSLKNLGHTYRFAEGLPPADDELADLQQMIHFYLGLYYECIGDGRSSDDHLRAALRLRASADPAENLSGVYAFLTELHCLVRHNSLPDESGLSRPATCRQCKRSFVPEHNHSLACCYHAGVFSGRLNRVNDVDTSDLEFFWSCCGEYDREHPGCVVTRHMSFDEADDATTWRSPMTGLTCTEDDYYVPAR
ncbi:unnamed protein product [Vitrella brassicaformis CCMP3155]|uniref:Uncharacterized protein n=2 Tax=Vitrella brassicaformis TaxID=1169539 RepID=A0A0G4GZ08_VITBC|nr:unnamed protein product [Vitrella brassicaformis CCMP3155]|eukprot:CEM36176.1 unnamed protein product [Vitrella brassicaformis CCMP3155]